MRDDVMKGLVCCIQSYDTCECPDDCKYRGKYHECEQGLMKEALELLREQESTGGWISVDERLPEKDTDVLCAVFGHDCIVCQDGETVEQAIERVRRECRYTTVGYIDDDGFWNKQNGYQMVVQPSYWMPFPEPPKGVA